MNYCMGSFPLIPILEVLGVLRIFMIMIYLRINLGHEVELVFFMDTDLIRKDGISMTWKIRNSLFLRDVVYDETNFPYFSLVQDVQDSNSYLSK